MASICIGKHLCIWGDERKLCGQSSDRVSDGRRDRSTGQESVAGSMAHSTFRCAQRCHDTTSGNNKDTVEFSTDGRSLVAHVVHESLPWRTLKHWLRVGNPVDFLRPSRQRDLEFYVTCIALPRGKARGTLTLSFPPGKWLNWNLDALKIHKTSTSWKWFVQASSILR